MKPKITDDGTRVASILCGLGYNLYTNKPYYPDHDITLAVDTLLTENDINRVRYIIYIYLFGISFTMSALSDNAIDIISN